MFPDTSGSFPGLGLPGWGMSPIWELLATYGKDHLGHFLLEAFTSYVVLSPKKAPSSHSGLDIFKAENFFIYVSF